MHRFTFFPRLACNVASIVGEHTFFAAVKKGSPFIFTKPKRMWNSVALVETLVAHNVKTSIGVGGSAFIDTRGMFAMGGRRFFSDNHEKNGELLRGKRKGEGGGGRGRSGRVGKKKKRSDEKKKADKRWKARRRRIEKKQKDGWVGKDKEGK